MSIEIREVAERILFGQSLDEKLAVGQFKGMAPKLVLDSKPECGVSMPELPNRPKELLISPRGVDAGVASSFPKVNKMGETAERGKMLHFLANHELLATELMALVLLKFPNAPAEFRQGVYETMREEQAHTLMYMRRMKECGMEFGELPVNDYFWRMVAPMECPMDFVSRLSLVFEQANLDYSLHYGKLFREVGDTGTAAVLEKIYQDEIGHVGHGLKWFRKWKDEGMTDWSAFKKQMHFPLTLARAKGMAPYDREGRELAGIDREWVDALEVIEQSRGRTPIVHWFNPNEELAMPVTISGVGPKYQPKKAHLLLEKDLSMLPLAWARRDDVVLVDEMPSREHLVRLKRHGLVIPEFLSVGNDDDLLERKIGGLKPWAWGPVAREMMRRYKCAVPQGVDQPWQNWRAKDAYYFSKQAGLDLATSLCEEVGQWCETKESVLAAIQRFSEDGDVLLKAPWSSAGRGHLRLTNGVWTKAANAWLDKVISQQCGVVVEPWLERVLDFSAQYEVTQRGVKLVGMTRVVNDSGGRYLGTIVHHKWTSGLDARLAEFLFKDQNVMQLYKVEMPKRIQGMLDDDFVGNFGVDAMVYLEKGSYRLRKVVEVNPRVTMGRVALELYQKCGSQGAGLYQIVRKSKIDDLENWLLKFDEISDEDRMQLSVPINDPIKAREFIAVWHIRTKIDDLQMNLFL